MKIKNFFTFSIVVVFLMGLGFLLSGNGLPEEMSQESSPQIGQGGAPPTSEVINQKESPLKEIGGGNRSGTVMLGELNEEVLIRIKMNNLSAAQGSQPVHIHLGTCQENGRTLYPLNDLVDGVSETILNIGLSDLRAQMPLSIGIHPSKNRLETMTACSDLTR